MTILVIWLLCAVGAAMIASSKGRSGGGWFVAGLLFSVFAILIVACLPSLSTDPQHMPRGHVDQLIRDGKLKKCPDCAEAVQPEAKVCRFCGHEFTNDEGPRKPSVAERLLRNPAFDAGRRS